MKLIVWFNNREDYVNIAADSIVRSEDFICAYKGTALVGMFDLSVVMVAYLSEKGG